MVNPEAQLDDFSLEIRRAALSTLVAGDIGGGEQIDAVNMHCHTFYSYNAYGYSPIRLAWLGRQHHFKAMGIVDFDVLDGVEEFLTACDTAGMRGSAGMETRVFVPEFAAREINSPGEPGIAYYMGIGFVTGNAPPPADQILAGLRLRAEKRNREMVTLLNAFLEPLTIDYDHDVLPLTPNGNATERHILSAYTNKAKQQIEHTVRFWAAKLSLPDEKVADLIADEALFQNQVRAKLMKAGGAGYIKPGPDTFPAIDEVNRLITACSALPTVAWLDGFSEGEQAIEELLQLLIQKGAVAINIIPDRNWNLPDPNKRLLKLEKLYKIVHLAQQLDLPINVGTEMNSPGQKLVDDFDVPELAPLRNAFLNGSYFVYGHTTLQQAAGLGYQSTWAALNLPTRRAKNEFYCQVGQLVQPGGWKRLSAVVSEHMSPEQILSCCSLP
jgi:hypothetical protein